jgi:DNA invertase Pin-like site-specific DNA recombinase
MKKAAVYLRVSTDEQSVDSQRADCLKAAESRGFEPVIFEDKASGSSFSRKSLDAMMERVRKREFSAVICYKLDRLGRSLPHLAQLVMELDSHDVGLVAASQGIDTSDSNPVARMQLHVLMAVAEFERSMIRERTWA